MNKKEKIGCINAFEVIMQGRIICKCEWDRKMALYIFWLDPVFLYVMAFFFSFLLSLFLTPLRHFVWSLTSHTWLFIASLICIYLSSGDCTTTQSNKIIEPWNSSRLQRWHHSKFTFEIKPNQILWEDMYQINLPRVFAL